MRQDVKILVKGTEKTLERESSTSHDVNNAIFELIHTSIGQRPEFDNESQNILRYEIEDLFHQGVFNLGGGVEKILTEYFNKEYSVAFLSEEDLERQQSKNIEKLERGLKLELKENTIKITIEKYGAIRFAKLGYDDILGYDALRVEVSIDLKKLDPQQLLLTPGCVQAKYTVHGFREKIEDVGFKK